jgi:hypothetical protein
MSLEWFLSPAISKGNPLKNLASFENSRPRMEFKKTKVENNNLMRRRRVFYSYTLCASSF